ncbi:MAG: DUF423 domain-containing protein [Halieaceae bacterium]|nr:DUF423 domain-containing protein [Halieaceae bacterium]
MQPEPNHSPFLGIAAGSGLLAVALGAFGAHALRAQLDARSMGIFETAVEYHFAHTLALLAVALLGRVASAPRLLHWAGLAFTVGLVLFSGSLYLLSTTGIRWLGAITPLGGLSFIAGWSLLLAWSLGPGRRQS